MNIRDKDFRLCLDKAAEVAALYQLHILGGLRVPRSIDSLQDICAQYLNKKIEIYQLDEDPKGCVKGSYLSKPDGYEIILVPGLNPCWTRFIKAKEMFHVLLDEDEYRTVEIDTLIEQLMDNFPGTDSNPAATSELITEFAAMEFLFPFRDRELILANSNGQLDSLKIAHQYKIPQVHVEMYLTPGYMNGLRPHMPPPGPPVV